MLGKVPGNGPLVYKQGYSGQDLVWKMCVQLLKYTQKSYGLGGPQNVLLANVTMPRNGLEKWLQLPNV